MRESINQQNHAIRRILISFEFLVCYPRMRWFLKFEWTARSDSVWISRASSPPFTFARMSDGLSGIGSWAKVALGEVDRILIITIHRKPSGP